MATLKSIPIASILVGERARPADEEHALAIAASMAERGLINPITVRPTPAAQGGKTPYTLVAGAHRLRGGELNQWAEIDALIVSTDVAEAQLIEISENLFRNELSALDRSIFVTKFREIFEEKHGKINPNGGRPKKQGHDDHVIFAPGKELSERVQERLGIGARTYRRISSIGLKLHPHLRASLRGTPAEDDQKLLLKLCAMADAEQLGIVAALKHEPDVRKVLASDKQPKPEIDQQAALLKKLTTAWDAASEETRSEFLGLIGIDPVESLSNLMASIKQEAAA